MMPTLAPSFFLAMYCAEAVPWLGSVKHIWKTLALRGVVTLPSASGWPPMTSLDDAEGVSSKTLSELVSAETATHGVVVVGPTRICRPQSFSLL